MYMNFVLLSYINSIFPMDPPNDFDTILLNDGQENTDQYSNKSTESSSDYDINNDSLSQATQHVNTSHDNDDSNTMNEYHDIYLETEFSKIVSSYFDKFIEMKKNNLNNIKNFKDNFVIFISYKSLNNDIFDGIVKIIDDMKINDLDNRNIKMMYYALEKTEKKSFHDFMYLYYQSIFQKFSCKYIHNQISSDEFYCDDFILNKICTFARKFDKKDFSDFFNSKNNENIENKNVILDNCCDTKDDFLIFSRLYRCVLMHLKNIANSIILSIKSSSIEDKRTKIGNLIRTINENLNTFKQDNLILYVSEINITDKKSKIQLKQMVYDNERKFNKLKVLRKYWFDIRFDYIYTLWPYSIDSDMFITYNKHDINQYKNLDAKLFRSKQKTDINNVKIALSNTYGRYVYVFVRIVKSLDEKNLSVRYLGMYYMLHGHWCNQIWMNVEYNYVKNDGIYMPHKPGGNKQLKNFFSALENILMQNINDGSIYLQYVLSHEIYSAAYGKDFEIKTTLTCINKKLYSLFSLLLDKGWSSEIIEKRQENLDYLKKIKGIYFNTTTLNVVELSEISQMWKKWTKNSSNDFKEPFHRNLFARFTYNKFDRQIQFHLEIYTDMIYDYYEDHTNFYNGIKTKLKEFIGSKQLNFEFNPIKNKNCQINNLFYRAVINLFNRGVNCLFNCDDFFNLCFDKLSSGMHEYLLFQPSLRENYFKLMLSNYILKKCFEFKIIDEPTYESILEEYALTSEFVQEDFKTYAISMTELKEKYIYSSTSYYNEICTNFCFTDDDKKNCNDVLACFCDFYKSLNNLMPEAEKNYNVDFEFSLKFPTYLPQHLWKELLDVIKEIFGDVKIRFCNLY